MLKKPTTYEEQISIIQTKGCVIDDMAFCRNALEKINYYRLSAYFLPFKTLEGNYHLETNFKTIYALTLEGCTIVYLLQYLQIF